jgi:hypothetical protein
LHFFIFDVLTLAGKDVMGEPLSMTVPSARTMLPRSLRFHHSRALVFVSAPDKSGDLHA